MNALTPFRGSRPLWYESPFASFLREMEAMFDRSFPSPMFTVANEGIRTQPVRADVRETDSEYIVEADLPGFDREEIDVVISDGCLTIKAERKEEVKQEEKGYIHQERKYQRASRSFYIEGIDQSKVKASHKNGVLTLMLPKQAESSSTRRIEIE